MNAAQAEESTDVIIGNLSVNDIPTKVLFNCGASHSFISRPFVAMHDLVTQVLPRPLLIVSPARRMTSRVFIRDSIITMGNYKFLSSPMVLGDSAMI